jgi:broad specificity phosphatase PhoE
MRLYLVRHAQSEANIGIHKESETALTDIGVEQAKRLGMYFKNKHLTKIYCSQLIRAKDTLDEIRPYVPAVPITYTKRINERDIGIYGHNIQKYREAIIASGLQEHEFRPPKGENMDDVDARAKEFISFLKKNHMDDNILVVSHGYFLKVMVVSLFGFHRHEGRYFSLHNASVSYFHMDENGKIKDFEVDDHKHLLMYSSYPR